MIRNVFLAFALLIVFLPGNAREGMWLPLFLDKYNIEEMRDKGFRLEAEDIYSINQTSMKDAVVRIGGCTGVVVSGRGLVLTNHHCAYRAIQSHSTVEDDYLTDGFWAMSEEEELPNPGLTVTFLVRMEDVTGRVLELTDDDMTEDERRAAIILASERIRHEAVEGTRFTAEVSAFYYGSEFYLFVYDVFEDVRLTGAPPSSVGKFGGDTDNWMWPRHTGDFAYFRIYAGDDNEPAGYSPSNTPYRSRAHIPVSTGGVKEGDFTMVYGFPGSTSQYLTSHAVGLITGLSNPHNIRLRDIRLDIMGREMERNDTVRIQYASKFAGVSNAWKRWAGENRGLARMDAVGRKRELEERFVRWAGGCPEREMRYGYIMPAFDSLYTALERYTLPFDYGREALLAIELVRFAGDFVRVADLSDEDFENVVHDFIPQLERSIAGFYRDYHLPVDQEIFIRMLEMYRDNVDTDFYPGFFDTVDAEFSGDFRLFVEDLLSNTVFARENELSALVGDFDKDAAGIIRNDPMTCVIRDIRAVYNDHVIVERQDINSELNILYRYYIEGLREMDRDRAFYPDANRTLRVAYGQVGGYYPRDAVSYNYYTTLSGVMEKYQTGEPDYTVPERLKELYDGTGYGEFARPGEIRISFIATNHTTGGNSGSPVINGNGHLIGVNFDRVWEGTMSDIMFDPEVCRNISVDVNYILYITDVYAGAGYLLEEMHLVP
ncbi:MAG: S46 family peptidase [Marinilabiliales bacterium]|nr:MAG: S46 family peptidase [Marinilabiliales bacterium]